MRTHQQQSCFGRPRGWRPAAEEPIAAPTAAIAATEEYGDPSDSDYGIKIIWSESGRRPGERLEKMVHRLSKRRS